MAGTEAGPTEPGRRGGRPLLGGGANLSHGGQVRVGVGPECGQLGVAVVRHVGQAGGAGGARGPEQGTRQLGVLHPHGVERGQRLRGEGAAGLALVVVRARAQQEHALGGLAPLVHLRAEQGPPGLHRLLDRLGRLQRGAHARLVAAPHRRLGAQPLGALLRDHPDRIARRQRGARRVLPAAEAALGLAGLERQVRRDRLQDLVEVIPRVGVGEVLVRHQRVGEPRIGVVLLRAPLRQLVEEPARALELPELEV